MKKFIFVIHPLFKKLIIKEEQGVSIFYIINKKIKKLFIIFVIHPM